MSTITDDLVIYDRMEQRTPEWFAARAGIVTASTVGTLITRSRPAATTVTCPEPKCAAPAGMPCVNLKTGADIASLHDGRKQAAVDSPEPDVLTVAKNDTSRAFIATLAAERITGHVEDTYMSGDMWRGVEIEPMARDAYADTRRVTVEEVGFITRDIGNGIVVGWSPDGLVGEVGAVEIKAPRQKKQLLTVLSDDVPPEHMPQLQAALFVSGRDWIDFVQYVGRMPLWVKRVHPDPRWFTAIEEAARTAEKDIRDFTTRYATATAGQPAMQPLLDPIDTITF